MAVEIKIPSPGESISEVEVASWLVNSGDYVEKDQEIAEVESDKATLPLLASESGVIEIMIEAGSMAGVGDIAAKIDTDAAPPKGKPKDNSGSAAQEQPKKDDAPKAETKKENREKPEQHKPRAEESTEKDDASNVKVTPVARQILKAHDISVDDILKGLKRLGKNEVEAGMQQLSGQPAAREATRDIEEKKMSSLRRKLSQRLVAVKNETAMLTTFNEADMSVVMAMRKKYQSAFVEKHGTKLGFMSFFTKAASEALLQFPNVNSMIDGENIITPKYTDIGIAVQTDKGLMVPVLRNTETKSLADIEKEIIELAQKARKARLSMDEMTGGTFTITNGGVFGSMMSTPIINPPQSAILGMHNIIDRPVAVNGKVEIRPMMYLALSYDHRIIDGRDSVSFLVKIKELIENPVNLLYGANDPEKALFEL